MSELAAALTRCDRHTARHALIRAERAPSADTVPPAGDSHVATTTASPRRHAAPPPRTTPRQRATKTAQEPLGCATTCRRAGIQTRHRPCGPPVAPPRAAGGLGWDRARGCAPRPRAEAATSPPTAPATAPRAVGEGDAADRPGDEAEAHRLRAREPTLDLVRGGRRVLIAFPRDQPAAPRPPAHDTRGFTARSNGHDGSARGQIGEGCFIQ
jgi:hypothetical protein